MGFSLAKAIQLLGYPHGNPHISKEESDGHALDPKAPFKANGFMLALNGSTGVWEEGVGRARRCCWGNRKVLGKFEFQQGLTGVPSGELVQNYGKSQYLMGK